eukprot:TRINITY_DN10415_c0_g1_i2.p1 TRINITY_DN10415_c0_g1~~TRINITY_DN10415_c0_g1_i2.p1  ORF type:complete len:489 (+),score=130.21 TRINITY_DN10415_c0_g1_i2:34-1500(+)
MEWFGTLLEPNPRRRRARPSTGGYASGGRGASRSMERPKAPRRSPSRSRTDAAALHELDLEPAVPNVSARARTSSPFPAAEEAWGEHQQDPSAESLLSSAAEPPSYAASMTPTAAALRPKKEKRGEKVKVRTRNVLVLGGRGTGKSSFVNTYRRAVTEGDEWATAPVGRVGGRGTALYEPCFVPGEAWVLVDTPGWPMKQPLGQCPQEQALYAAMLRGLEWKADVTADRWGADTHVQDSTRRNRPPSKSAAPPAPAATPSNAVDHVVFVVSAADIIRDNGVASLLNLTGVAGRFSASIAKVRELESRFVWWEQQLGNAPFVVVTHLDAVSPWGMQSVVEQKIREALDKIVHKNRIFCMTNPDDPADLTRQSAATLHVLHKKLMVDIDARTSAVLQGRNAMWGAPSSPSSRRDPETPQPPPRRPSDVDEGAAGAPAPAAPVLDMTSQVATGRRACAPHTGAGAVLWTMPVAEAAACRSGGALPRASSAE